VLKIRISLVDYLNSAPLGWSFLHGPLKGEYEVVLSSPARCAEQLAAGEADIGLIPSIEYQRIPELQIIPGIAVAAVNKVRSVLMVRPRNKRELRSLALDTSSRTSVALIRLLLEFRLGLKPVLVPHPPDLTAMLRSGRIRDSRPRRRMDRVAKMPVCFRVLGLSSRPGPAGRIGSGFP